MRRFSITIFALAAGLVAGCGDHQGVTHDAGPAAKHEHKPPHGGTPVVFGQEEYHLELVMDAPAGKLQAYVFDGEMDNFVRITAPSFEVTAKLPGQDQVLTFTAVPNTATGETVGDTALFEAQAEWLKTTRIFDAVLKEVTVKGTTYRDVAFNFPKGNDKN